MWLTTGSARVVEEEEEVVVVVDGKGAGEGMVGDDVVKGGRGS